MIPRSLLRGESFKKANQKDKKSAKYKCQCSSSKSVKEKQVQKTYEEEE